MSDKKEPLPSLITYHSSLITPKNMSDKLEQIFRGWPERHHGPRTFRLGDTVRIRSGVFAAFAGEVEGINQSKRLLKVRIRIVGRTAAVKLGFDEVETASSS
jgi:transcription termination/antitermination protein NusG